MRNSPYLGLAVPLVFVILLVVCWMYTCLSWSGIIAIPLIILLPGYTISWLIFPSTLLGGLERIVISCGISLAVVIVSGIVLNITPWGLQKAPWAALLVGISMGATSVSLVRYRRQLVNLGSSIFDLRILLRLRYSVFFASAILITLMAMILAYTGAKHQPEVGFTQLWIQPASINTSKGVIEFGVLSMEPSATQYRLVVEVDDEIIQEWKSLLLQPGESWATNFTIPLSTSDAKIEVKLFRDDLPNAIYRQVNLQGNILR